MKILIAGDFCANNRVGTELKNHNYNGLFGQVKARVEQADYSFINMECPIVKHDSQPILKCGPNLKSSHEMVEALQWAGFKCVTLANNHIYDYGETGILDTLMCLNERHVDYVGVGNSLKQASKVLYKEVKGKTFAIINCCEHEFSIATDTTSGANPLNPIQQYYKIKEARRKADYVLVIVHGGHEHYQLPSPRMKETYRFFVDAGADAVVNHHQHCYSGYEVYKEKPIFYGIGNFLFDWEGIRNQIWNEGYMVELDFCSGFPSFELIPYVQCNEEAAVVLLNEKDKFEESIRNINAIIADDQELTRKYKDWINADYNTVKLLFEPYLSRISKGLYNRGLIPSLVPRNKYYMLVNYINCESHLDRIRVVLNSELNDK